MSEYPQRRSLYRLIYASRQSETFEGEDEVTAIIAASIRNNREVAVTGLLLVHEGWFLQVLEGPYEAVMTTYGRIINDPRHADPRVIKTEQIDTREFGDWNMCARQIGAADDAILDALDQRAAFEPFEFTPASALRLLKAVRGIQERNEVKLLTGRR